MSIIDLFLRYLVGITVGMVLLGLLMGCKTPSTALVLHPQTKVYESAVCTVYTKDVLGHYPESILLCEVTGQ